MVTVLKKFLTRKIIIVSLVSFFTDIASEMLYPVMPLYLKSIGFSIFIIGVLEGIAEATAGLSKGYFGVLSDKSGKRVPFIRYGYALSAISKPLLILMNNPFWVFLMRSSHRLGKGIRTGARDALLSDETTKENKGKVFGFHRALDTAGALLGPVIAIIYLNYFPESYKNLFILSIIPGMMAIAITFLIRDASRAGTDYAKTHFMDFIRYLKKSPKSYRILFIGLITFALFNSSDMFILLRIKTTGISDMEVIWFYVFYNFIYALTSFPIGIIADKLSLKTVLVFGLVIFAVVYAGLAVFNSTLIFYLVLGLYGLYAASTEGIAKALISNVAAPEDTATAIGTFSAFNSVMLLLSSTLAGLIWVQFGPQATFLLSACGAFAVAVYLTVALKLK